MEATTFRCPCCGSPLTFGAGSQEMECESCGNSFALENLEQAAHLHVEDTTDEQMHWDMPVQRDMSDEAAGRLQAYRCQTCGAEILADPEKFLAAYFPQGEGVTGCLDLRAADVAAGFVALLFIVGEKSVGRL